MEQKLSNYELINTIEQCILKDHCIGGDCPTWSEGSPIIEQDSCDAALVRELVRRFRELIFSIDSLPNKDLADLWAACSLSHDCNTCPAKNIENCSDKLVAEMANRMRKIKD